MNVLTVGGKSYVKASVIARDLGYTTDYVGQLCRSEKVDATLVGRSWYVNEDSIRAHKRNRYRSTHSKTKETLKKEIHLKIEENSADANPAFQSNFYSRSKSPVNVAYEPDNADLIPVVSKKTGTIDVGLADAVEVDIVSKSSSYVFDTPDLPEIQFKGALKVTEFEDAKEEEPSKKRMLHVKKAKQADAHTHNKPKNIASSSDTVSTVKNEKPRHSVASAPHTQSKPHENEAESLPYVHRPVIIVFSATLSLCLAILLVGLEAQIWVSKQTMTTSYRFNTQSLRASVHDSFSGDFTFLNFSTNRSKF